MYLLSDFTLNRSNTSLAASFQRFVNGVGTVVEHASNVFAGLVDESIGYSGDRCNDDCLVMKNKDLGCVFLYECRVLTTSLEAAKAARPSPRTAAAVWPLAEPTRLWLGTEVCRNRVILR